MGVNYQLLKDGVNYGIAIVGTGNALSWNVTEAGTYTCITSNSVILNGSAVVTTSYTSPPTGDSVQLLCGNASIANLVSNGMGVKWYDEATGGNLLLSSYSLINGTTYYASQTINGCESQVRLGIKANINITPPPNGISTQSFCGEATLANLVLTGNEIKWYDAAIGGNLLSLNHLLINGSTYYASQTIGGCESSNRLSVSVTTTAAPSGNTTQSFCKISTIGDLTVNGSLIKWYDSAVGGNLLFSFDTLMTENTYYASQTIGGCESQDRLGVTIGMYYISAPTGDTLQTYCNNALITNLIAFGNNIKWYDAANGGNLLALTDTLVNGFIYNASQTQDGCVSQNRLVVKVIINQVNAPSGNSLQSYCEVATLSNLVVTGNEIKWYDASTSGNLLPLTTTLANGYTYFASQTIGGCESQSRLGVLYEKINIYTPIGDTIQIFCNNATISDITAIGNGIRWYDSSIGGNLLLPTDTLIYGHTYYASQTIGGCESQNRLGVNVNIAIIQEPYVDIAPIYCYGAIVADLIASGTDIRWYDAETGGNLLSPTELLVNMKPYYASQTIEGCESHRGRQVTPLIVDFPPSPPIPNIQTFCNEATIVDLDPNNNGIKWYNSAIGGDLLSSSYSLANGNTYYASQTEMGCESHTRSGVFVTILNIPPPIGDTIQSFCFGATVADLIPNDFDVKWYDSFTGGNLLPSNYELVNGNSYYASETIDFCESQSRLNVKVNLNKTAPPIGDTVQKFCNNAFLTELVAIGNEIKWYDSAIGGNSLAVTEPLTDGNMYFASQTINGCESQDRLGIYINIANVAAPYVDIAPIYCYGAIIADLIAAGTDIKWYDAEIEGNLLSPTEPLVYMKPYYASQTIEGCEGQRGRQVTPLIIDLPPPPLPNYQSFCNDATIADLFPYSNVIRWYDSAIGGNLLLSNYTLSNGNIYYASQTDIGCESHMRSGVFVNIINTPAPIGDTIQSLCFGNNVSNIVAIGNEIKWYDSPIGGNLLNSSETINNGNTYYASQTIGGCESHSRLSVTSNITMSILTGTATGISSNFATCNGNIVSDCGFPIIERGICYGIYDNPDISFSKISVSGTIGIYSANLINLNSGTVYHYRAYSTNAFGTTYGEDATFTTATETLLASELTSFGNVCVNTNSVTNSFTLTGYFLSLDDISIDAPNGFTLSTSSNGIFTSTLTLPQSGGSFLQILYVKFTPTLPQSYYGNIIINGGGASPIYVIANGIGIYLLPSIASPISTNLTINSAILGSNITSIGCSDIIERGVYYSTINAFADGTGIKVSESPGPYSIGAFTEGISGLSPSTNYYYKAFATNSVGTIYSPQRIFRTLTINLSSSTLSNFGSVCLNTTVGPNSFIITGTNLTNANINVGALNGYTFSTSANGNYYNSLSLVQPGGSFSQTIYVKFSPTAVQSYIGNISISGGGATTYNCVASGNGVNSSPPTITSPTSSDLTSISAILGGNITAIGCSDIIERGIYFSNTNGFANGTGIKVSDTSGIYSTGAFTVGVTGLSPSTHYYFKAFATNSNGTAFSPQGSFNTSSPHLSSTGGGNFVSVCINTIGVDSFNIIGTNLTTSNLTVGAFNGYAYSTSLNGIYTSSLTLIQSGGTFNQTIYIKFSPVTVQSYSGNITISGGGATSINKIVLSNGVFSAPSISAPSKSTITTNSALLGGTITATGCSDVIERGVYYSTISGFANGTGNKVSETTGPFSTGVYTIEVTGLSPSTVYYFKAFATNSGGTVFSTQGTFSTTCMPISNFPWTENFDAMSSIGTSVIPNCWKIESSSGTPWSSIKASGNSYNDPSSFPNYITCFYSPIYSDKYLITPGFSLTSGKSYNFNFKFAGDGYTGWDADVRYNTLATGTSSIMLGSAFLNNNTTTSSIYNSVSNTFTPPINETYFFIIHVKNSSTPYYLGFDDFSLSELPPPPIITNLSSNFGCPGTSLTIKGINLSGTSAANITVGGSEVSSIILNTDTELVVILGLATTGNVSVTTPFGTAISQEIFTFNSLPEKPSTPLGSSQVCQSTTTTVFTDGSLNSTSYHWNVIPQNAGVIVGTEGTANVEWNQNFFGIAHIVVNGENACGYGPLSDSLTIHVEQFPLKPEIPSGQSFFCKDTFPTLYNTAGSSGATFYHWFFSPTIAGSLFEDIPGLNSFVDWNSNYSGEAKLYVVGENSCGLSEASDTLHITYVNLTAPIIDSVIQTSCDLSTGGVILKGLPAIGTWTLIKNPGGDTVSGLGTTSIITNLLAGTYSFAVINSLGCISNESANLIINPQPILSIPTGESSQLFCSVVVPTVSDLVANGNNIKWYGDSLSNIVLDTSTALVNGLHYWASQTVCSFESSERLEVIVTINNIPEPPTGESIQTFCFNATIADLIAIGNNIQWYTDSVDGFPLASSVVLQNGMHYYASQTIDGCESKVRLKVTTNVYLPSIQAKCPSIDAGCDVHMTCNQSSVNLNATIVPIGSTTNYTVTPVAYAPPLPYNSGNPILLNGDDIWGDAITLPFNFCFYNNNYSQIIPGSNGLVTFDIANVGRMCPWEVSSSCPSTNLPLNSIYGVFQDLDMSVGGNMYSATLGSYPCRSFIINWNQVSLFSCNSLFATSQIVLYEGTNIIEIYIKDKPQCSQWNNGSALIGIQNSTGTNGLAPSDRNWFNWSVNNEAWCFTPNGQPNYNVIWYKGQDSIGSGTSISVNPVSTTTYIAEATYFNCGGNAISVSDSVIVFNDKPQAPEGDTIQSFSTSDKISDLIAIGAEIKWYDSATGGNLLQSDMALIDGNTYYASQTINGCESQGRLEIIVNTQSLKTIILHLYLEGLFDSNTNSMTEAQEIDWNTGLSYAKYGNGVADKIQIDLYEAIAPYDPVGLSINNIDLSTNGMASFQISSTYNGTYYIRVHNRNHLETWSAIPVPFNTNPIDYYFTTDVFNAYHAQGGNDPQVQVASGLYAFYLGDLDQSLNVDFDDFNLFEPNLNDGIYGFTTADFNGNGLVDFDDFNIFEPRLNEGPFTQYPGMP
ncbi:MAG: hypothetical protein WCH34_13710 [Bacteroidota bacterium]